MSDRLIESHYAAADKRLKAANADVEAARKELADALRLMRKYRAKLKAAYADHDVAFGAFENAYVAVMACTGSDDDTPARSN